MAPKRNNASSTSSPAPATIPANVNNASIKPSTAASSSIHTDSPLKSYSSSSASNPTTPSNVSATAKPSRSATSGTNTSSTSSSSASGKVNGGGKVTADDAQDVVRNMWNRYVKETPQRTKLIDVFMAFLVTLGAIQFVYCVLAGNYPFNAFLSGFSATVGQFVLTASLRIQTNPANKSEFSKSFSDERAFADFVFGSLILHFFCVNFIN